jgi:hypothetical protein
VNRTSRSGKRPTGAATLARVGRRQIHVRPTWRTREPTPLGSNHHMRSRIDLPPVPPIIRSLPMPGKKTRCTRAHDRRRPRQIDRMIKSHEAKNTGLRDSAESLPQHYRNLAGRRGVGINGHSKPTRTAFVFLMTTDTVTCHADWWQAIEDRAWRRQSRPRSHRYAGAICLFKRLTGTTAPKFGQDPLRMGPALRG